MTASCERHAWAAVGVTTIDDGVVRVWVCEVCQAWTREPLTGETELPFDEAGLGRR